MIASIRPSTQPLLERDPAEGGAALSEMPFGWEPRGRDFPAATASSPGLSLGVVVVEAARRSGSLITARFALEQGREVFAVPGSPLDPRAEGTNDLIRQGATLCAAAEHVASALAPLIGRELPPDGAAEEPAFWPRGDRQPLWDELDLGELSPAPKLPIFPDQTFLVAAAEDTDAIQAPLIDFLGPAPVSVDDLARQSGLPVRAVQQALLELELAGRLERHGGNAVSLAPDR